MPDYAITFAKSARKELEKLAPSAVARIFPKIEALARFPRPPHRQKLKGNNALWRIRVGDYRVLYAIDDQRSVVDISSVGHRREVYRD